MWPFSMPIIFFSGLISILCQLESRRQAPRRQAPRRQAPLRQAPLRQAPLRQAPLRQKFARDSSSIGRTE